MMGFQFAAGRRQAAFNNFLMEAWRPSPRHQRWNINSNGCRLKNSLLPVVSFSFTEFLTISYFRIPFSIEIQTVVFSFVSTFW